MSHGDNATDNQSLPALPDLVAEYASQAPQASQASYASQEPMDGASMDTRHVTPRANATNANMPPSPGMIARTPTRILSAVRNRDHEYYTRMDAARRMNAQDVLSGVARCTPEATKAAATRVRTNNQLFTLTKMFNDMAVLREFMEPRVYSVLMAAAANLAKPNGKITPSNRSSTPLYVDLEAHLQEMLRKKELDINAGVDDTFGDANMMLPDMDATSFETNHTASVNSVGNPAGNSVGNPVGNPVGNTLSMHDVYQTTVDDDDF